MDMHLKVSSVAWLLTRILECVAPRAESQRDSATKPRVARNELPWENASHIGDNSERVVADDNGNKTMPQPLWGCESSVTFPSVARSSQPWALLRNPFGIEDTRTFTTLFPGSLFLFFFFFRLRLHHQNPVAFRRRWELAGAGGDDCDGGAVLPRS